jgi:hypothetical protein
MPASLAAAQPSTLPDTNQSMMRWELRSDLPAHPQLSRATINRVVINDYNRRQGFLSMGLI